MLHHRRRWFVRIALPVWGNLLSPVLDTAARLLVVELPEGETAPERGKGERREVPLPPEPPPLRAARIASLGVEVLICGAVSRPLAWMLEARGMRVVPWVRGEVDRVIEAWQAGALSGPGFAMPGWGRGRGRWGRGGGRGRRGPGGWGGDRAGGPGCGFGPPWSTEEEV